MELALGTVQFGIPYGLAGRSEPVPEYEVRAILEYAFSAGIRILDTAAAYGTIERRLRRLTGNNPFRIVTKLPAMPQPATVEQAKQWAITQLNSAMDNLGDRLDTVMFHRADDLLETHGMDVWHICSEWAAKHDVRLGASCYDPQTLTNIRSLLSVEVAQLPSNALDQRLRTHAHDNSGGVELHVRSAFLQGLLLMDEASATRRVPAAHSAITRWHTWLRQNSMEALPAALGLVKSLKGVHCCVVGVDRLNQLEELTGAWASTPPLEAPELASVDPSIIDPRNWHKPS